MCLGLISYPKFFVATRFYLANMENIYNDEINYENATRKNIV